MECLTAPNITDRWGDVVLRFGLFSGLLLVNDYDDVGFSLVFFVQLLFCIKKYFHFFLNFCVHVGVCMIN